MLVTNHKVGADIECFLKDREGNIISAEGHVKGTKRQPYVPNPSLGEFFSISLDNVLAEFTIAPATSSKEFVKNINISKGLLKESLPAEFSTFFYPDNLMDKKFLRTQNARTFGCDVSYSAWDNKPISIDRNSYPTLRSAGFHVHVGYDGVDEKINNIIIKTLDLFLGVPSILIEPENLRKTLYGKAGEFRNKPYGVEYRTLSSFFASSDELTNWIYNNTEKAIEAINNYQFIEENESDCVKIQTAINSCDKGLATELIEKYGIQMP